MAMVQFGCGVEPITQGATTTATTIELNSAEWGEFHSPDLDVTIRRVTALMDADEEDDATQPTEYAIQLTLRFLMEAASLLAGDVPRAAATVTDEGGIRLFWREPGRSVQLTVPPHHGKALSVYHRKGAEHATERDASPQVLAHWLDWFARA